MVKVKKNLTGIKFGRLTVIKQGDDYITIKGRHKPRWWCQCDCNNPKLVLVRGDALTGGTTQSCGCYHSECAKKLGESILNDLTGRHFGRLTVVKRGEDIIAPNGKHIVTWLCSCSCGNSQLVTIRADLLRNESTKSCGCLSKELTSERSKARKGIKIGRYKSNTYELSRDYGIGYDCKGHEYYFDLEDFKLIDNYTWNVGTNGYVCCANEQLYMQNIICPSNDLNLIPFHKNKIPYDNRRSNLELKTIQQGSSGKGFMATNTSGFPGVSYSKERDMFEVSIGYNYRSIDLGRYGIMFFTEAVEARILAEQKYFKEHINISHLKILNYIQNGGKLEYGNKELIYKILEID